MTNKYLLAVAGLLIIMGLTKFDPTQLLNNNNRPVAVVDNLELVEPTNENLKKEAEDIVVLLQEKLDKKDLTKFLELRNLYLDLGVLISLDGENEVIKTTDEIRQANSMAGIMLNLDLKNKYPGLAKENNDVLVAAIGDDSILLSKELRTQAIEAFKALAWAYNKGCK